MSCHNAQMTTDLPFTVSSDELSSGSSCVQPVLCDLLFLVFDLVDILAHWYQYHIICWPIISPIHSFMHYLERHYSHSVTSLFLHFWWITILLFFANNFIIFSPTLLTIKTWLQNQIWHLSLYISPATQISHQLPSDSLSQLTNNLLLLHFTDSPPNLHFNMKKIAWV